jgi:hypothetical protein
MGTKRPGQADLAPSSGANGAASSGTVGLARLAPAPNQRALPAAESPQEPPCLQSRKLWIPEQLHDLLHKLALLWRKLVGHRFSQQPRDYVGVDTGGCKRPEVVDELAKLASPQQHRVVLGVVDGHRRRHGVPASSLAKTRLVPEELSLERACLQRVEPPILEERKDLVRELALRGRKRFSGSQIEAIAHVLQDHRFADRPELREANPIDAGASSHRLEFFVGDAHGGHVYACGASLNASCEGCAGATCGGSPLRYSDRLGDAILGAFAFTGTVTSLRQGLKA